MSDGDVSYSQIRSRLHAIVQDRAFVTSEKQAIRGRGFVKSPRWLFDFRAALLDSESMNLFAEAFWEQCKDLHPFQVAGAETVGIALMAAVVMKGRERGTPVNGLFVRKSRKKDGLMKYVEGQPTGDPVIIVDDIINSGTTLNKQVAVLQDEGLVVKGAFLALAFRKESAYASIIEKGIVIKSIFGLPDFGLEYLSHQESGVVKNLFDVRWYFKSGDPNHALVVEKSAPVICGGRVIFATSDGVVSCLRQNSGEVLWRFTVGAHPKGKGILSDPRVYDEKVYFGAYDGRVYALDIHSGKKIWEYWDADWIGSSPTFDERRGVLFIGLEYAQWGRQGGIVALDAQTGVEIWKQYIGSLVHSSPLYISEEDVVVIGSNQGVVFCYEACSGELRWRFETRGSVKASFAYDFKRKLVLFGSFDRYLHAVSVKDGLEIFSFATGEAIFSTPSIADDVVYVTSLDKCMYAVSLVSGAELWRHDTGGRSFASPVVVRDSVWIGSNSGRLLELERGSGLFISSFQISERIVSRVAYDVVTGDIVIPSHSNELYCIRKRAGPVIHS